MRLSVPVALLLALAGCLGGGAGDAGEAPAAAAPTATTGVLTGLVIDDAVRPLVANVTLLPGDRTVATVAGQFQFDDVAPGSYLLVARADGYNTVQSTIAVVAGQASEARIVLAKLPDTAPFPVTYPFDGYVQASTGLVGAGGAGTDPTGATGCTCSFEAQAEPGVSRLVLEASWDDWMADPTGPTEFLWRVDALGANATAQGSGTSPLRVVLGSLDFPADGFQLSNATGFQVSIYPDAVWPAVSQQYSAFLTLWYRGPPPEGWTIQET